MTNKRPIAILVCLAGLMGGCNTQADLAYTPPVDLGPLSPQPVIASVEATDARKEAPHRLATIMGGFGNPLKTLDTTQPVKDEVARVFGQALQVRGLSRGDGRGPLAMQLVVRSFDADQLMRSQANVDLAMTLVDRGSGRVVYADRDGDRATRFDFMGNGVLASIGGLRDLAEQVLNRTVDRMLAKPGFRAAVAAPGPASVAVR